MTTNSSFETALALQRDGDITKAAGIYERLVRVNPNDSQALHYLGLAYMQLGNLPGASAVLERSLNVDPADANALNDYGIVKSKLGENERALQLFDRALALNSCHIDALSNVAAVLNSQRLPYEALPYLERLSALQPDSVETSFRLAQTCLKLGDADRAIAGLRRIIDLQPDHGRARLLLGEALESVGRFTQARALYLAVLRRDDNNIVALSRLLGLPEGEPEQAWVDKARDLVHSRTTADSDRIRLRLALGQHYDRNGAYAEAFENFRAGRALKFAKAPFDTRGYTHTIDRLIATFTPELFSALPRHGVKSDRPIFIVGMPRSGTTLVEQILASHSKVAGGGELTAMMTIDSQIHHLRGARRPYPEGIRDLETPDLERMAEQYLRRLDRVSKTADRVTDKQPFNFIHLGLIAVLLPRAQIIHCRRDPLDTCLSCYFTSFAEEFQFANDLNTVGKYYLDYHRLMAHWRRALSIPVLEVQYEDLVSNTARVVGEVLDHCQLPWEDSCLAFQDTRRSVRTPSRWQVRQPIYSRSVGRWKNYDAYLQPLKEMLSAIMA
ncbi:MAG TPA: sulfotransferase [Steroidobacteraceae bacterium]|jgi:tetratricopeptide (TPR) repeat protein